MQNLWQGEERGGAWKLDCLSFERTICMPGTACSRISAAVSHLVDRSCRQTHCWAGKHCSCSLETGQHFVRRMCWWPVDKQAAPVVCFHSSHLCYTSGHRMMIDLQHEEAHKGVAACPQGFMHVLQCHAAKVSKILLKLDCAL